MFTYNQSYQTRNLYVAFFGFLLNVWLEFDYKYLIGFKIFFLKKIY